MSDAISLGAVLRLFGTAGIRTKRPGIESNGSHETALLPGRTVPGAGERPQLRSRRLACDPGPVDAPRRRGDARGRASACSPTAFTWSRRSPRGWPRSRSTSTGPTGCPTTTSTSAITAASSRCRTPGSMEQLAEQTARIYSRRLDRSRPLWELYLIHGLEGGRVALVTKVHHAAVDGMSGGEILTMLYDLDPRAARGRAARHRSRLGGAARAPDDADPGHQRATSLPGHRRWAARPPAPARRRPSVAPRACPEPSARAACSRVPVGWLVATRVRR